MKVKMEKVGFTGRRSWK